MRNLLITFTALAVWGAGVIAPWFIASPKDPAMLAVFAFGIGLWAVMSAGAASAMVIILLKPDTKAVCDSAKKAARMSRADAILGNFKKEQ